MAVAKVTLNGTTLMDLTQDTTNASKTLASYTGHGADGEVFTGSYAPVSYEDGDEAEYGTASASLAGTNWQFNANITPPVSTLTFYINYTVDAYGRTTSCDCLEITSTEIVYIYGDESLSTPLEFAQYNSISIVNGTDVENATLIAWLQANATQI